MDNARLESPVFPELCSLDAGVMKFNQAAKELGLPRVTSIQNNYSLLVRLHFDVNLGEVCHKNNENVALLAYSPLAGQCHSFSLITAEAATAIQRKGSKQWHLGFSSS